MQGKRYVPHQQKYPEQQSELPPGYLKNGYFDSAGNMLCEVAVDWPKSLAQTLARQGMKTAQVRRFFSHVRRLEGRLKAGTTIDSLRAEISKLDSYAQNAVKRNNAPRLFQQFISQNLRWATKDEKHFGAFVNHFECLVAYYPETK